MHTQTQTEWEHEVSFKIFEFIKSELFLDLPYMSIALNELEPNYHDRLNTFATNGDILYFSSEQLMRLIKTNPLYLNRAYLHSVLHCIFAHLWQRRNRNSDLWNIACDIVVEYTIDHLEKKSVKRILSYMRQSVYKEIEEKGVSAQNVYMYLLSCQPKDVMAYKSEFFCDDHVFWPKESQENMKSSDVENQKRWSKISRQTSMEQKKQGKDEEEGERFLSWQIEASKSKRSYRSFLKSFSVLKEELKSNEDEFDLSYYTYGLRLYKNLPLIEPLESKESRKIQEFVIVLDTSYSTSGTLIENFLKETYAILSQNDSFFHTSKIHIIQCDNRIQTHQIVSSSTEMDALLKNFTITGGNGTDFRPAFEYVNTLIEEKICKEVSGLLYFTDGKGIYPRKRPNYKCAFLYLDDFDESMVPPWAMRLKLDPIEFLERK